MIKSKQFPYLHGFSKEEQQRLRNQAKFAEFEVYRNVNFSQAKQVLEVGSGVGAQSEILLRRFPDIKLTGIDANLKQIISAKKFINSQKHLKQRAYFKKMDAEKLSFKKNTFDAAFLCWILEHVPNPIKVLKEVKRVLAPNSPIYVTEVLNSSFFLDPYSPATWRYWMAFNDYQFENAGDPFIGAKLGNLLSDLNFKNINIEIKTWHFDKRNPQLRQDTILYWSNLLLSAKDHLLKHHLVDNKLVQKMQQELRHVASAPNAVFFYSFVQGYH